jgi:hypothetical protein
MRTCTLIVLYLFLFACKPSGDKPDMSIFDKPITPAAFAAQKQCMPPTSEQCVSVCYDPNRYCCCANPNTGGQRLVAKSGLDCTCGDPPQCR